MGKLTRIATTVLAATTIASGATAVAASSAQAQIRPGHYTYTVWGNNNDKILTSPAIVRGNRIFIVNEGTWYDVVSTKRGGSWTDTTVGRKNVWRSGDGYVGVSYLWPVPRHSSVTAGITLTPR